MRSDYPCLHLKNLRYSPRKTEPQSQCVSCSRASLDYQLCLSVA